MSDNYRDGCSKKWTIAWLLATPIVFLAWLSEVGRRG